MDKIKKVIIKYLLSEEGRKNSILLGGNGREVQEIEVEVSERILKIANVDTDGNVELNIGFKKSSSGKSLEDIIVDYEAISDEYGKYLMEKTEKKHFDKISELNELLNWEENRREKLKILEVEYKLYRNERKKKMQEVNIRREEECRIREQEQREYNEKRKLKEQKIKEEQEEKLKAYVDERSNWINEYGSQYLKNIVKLGYDVDSKYAIERANKEMPNFEVDIDDNSAWGEQDNPSEKAVEEVIELIENGYKAEVVWLTSPVNPDDEDDFEECEAIGIREYLGNYYLVKPI
ncbi:hypothetical protein [Clostridium sp. C2-6-12]|uniref:hypothetical protein n=1 Tax=Clostridium sp. C2-6-12 TaxID=2698832 RepID=UPI001370D149|nr:hypothetical protein [Clostridium sp. C2-6-12]